MENTTLYNATDIQTIFKCGRKKAYEIIHMTGFPSFKIDNMIFVERGELEKWLARAKGRELFT